eukprot:2843650-Alexandrium_andersonii.AAC.1
MPGRASRPFIQAQRRQFCFGACRAQGRRWRRPECFQGCPIQEAQRMFQSSQLARGCCANLRNRPVPRKVVAGI